MNQYFNLFKNIGFFNFFKSFQAFFLFLFFSLFLSSSFIFTSELNKEVKGKVAIEKKKQKKKEISFLKKINSLFNTVLFFDITGGAIKKKNEDGSLILDKKGKKQTVSFRFVVLLLIFGSIGFTIFYRFVNFRFFGHAIKIVTGKYDNPESTGEINHFKALTSALSGTIGLGNIAGVAVAISVGGPGAVFWMSLISLFSMTFKFHSCTLGQLFRKVNKDGSINGGPMYYLEIGLKRKNLVILGKILGIFFAIAIIFASFGAGNMFQANQAYSVFQDTFPQIGEKLSLSTSLLKDVFSVEISKDTTKNIPAILFGVLLSILSGIVIIGGVKKIGNVTSRLIPFMCLFYIFCAFIVIIVNIENLIPAIKTIFTNAFYDNAVYGGIFGVLIIGVTRAAFSNEAGLGSASIIHAAAKTKEPIREGFVAMLGPVIDTLILCNITAIVIVITDSWKGNSGNGVLMTSQAFSSVLSWFPYTLTVVVFLFCYSTIISWYYYGEKAFYYLLEKITTKEKIQKIALQIFRLFYLFFVIYGTVNTLKDIIEFSDIMLLSMVIPNIIGGIILAPIVWKETKKYIEKLKNNSF